MIHHLQLFHECMPLCQVEIHLIAKKRTRKIIIIMNMIIIKYGVVRTQSWYNKWPNSLSCWWYYSLGTIYGIYSLFCWWNVSRSLQEWYLGCIFHVGMYGMQTRVYMRKQNSNSPIVHVKVEQPLWLIGGFKERVCKKIWTYEPERTAGAGCATWLL